MTERRKSDDKIDELVGLVREHGVLLGQVHKSWFGKDNDGGYKKKIDQMETKVSIWSKVASSAAIAGLTALIKGFWR